jgi:hypothetical protein
MGLLLLGKFIYGFLLLDGRVCQTVARLEGDTLTKVQVPAPDSGAPTTIEVR